MLKFFALLLTVALASADVCERDCACKDFLYNHCSFYSFEKSTSVDENCKIYADETMEAFLDSCNQVGQPLKDELDQCFAAEGKCPTKCNGKCNTCKDNPCEGYVDVNCQEIGGGNAEEEQNNVPIYDGCVLFCFNLIDSSSLSFMTYSREEQICECFQSGSRTCKTQA